MVPIQVLLNPIAALWPESQLPYTLGLTWIMAMMVVSTYALLCLQRGAVRIATRYRVVLVLYGVLLGVFALLGTPTLGLICFGLLMFGPLTAMYMELWFGYLRHEREVRPAKRNR